MFRVQWLAVLLLFILFVSCKKPYNPAGALSSTDKFLVIDGVINSGDSTFIRLSRTKKFEVPVVLDTERNAQVTIESDANGSYPLSEISAGVYSGAPLTLNKANKYRVRIKTTDSKEYLSDFVVVKNAPPVDSVGFTAPADGVHIYVNAHDDTRATQYYRWEYTEDWQFHSWFESFTRGDQPRWQCYTGDVSSAVILASTASLSGDIVSQAPIALLPSTSEKVETKYTILVKQYALTSDAYSFWLELQKNTDRLGTIFDAQPSTNKTNYHCLTNPTETVVGYLSAGAITSKRIFITNTQLPKTYAVPNTYTCHLDTAFYYHPPYYYDPAVVGGSSGNSTVEGFYIAPLAPFGAPNYFTYSTDLCTDCTVRGKLVPPPYWVY